MAIVGALGGWLAGKIMRGEGFGLLGNVIIGILGAIVGGWVFDQLHITLGAGLLNSVLTAAIGAAIILFLAGLLKK
jgi:uncharacterized membrane protein YeaQ/YmgE (transglycosylase-associated protein family)